MCVCVVSVLPVQERHLDHFNTLVQTLQIPSKERIVFVENVPLKYSKENFQTFFNGREKIFHKFWLLFLVVPNRLWYDSYFQGLELIQFSSHKVEEAHMSNSLQSMVRKWMKWDLKMPQLQCMWFISDVEFAIKRNDEKSEMCIYRSTEHHMQNDRKEGNGHSSSPLPSVVSSRRVSIKNRTKTDDSRSTNFLKVRGLPMTINESYAVDLFIGKWNLFEIETIHFACLLVQWFFLLLI